MKAEHVNPVIQGAQIILSEICGEKGNMGKLTIKKDFSGINEVVVVIGMTGDLKGYAIFSMCHAAAHLLASRFMAGMSEAEVEEFLSSAVAEIMNMISGRISTLYYEMGIKNDITTPNYVEPPPPGFFDFVPPGSQLISIPLTFACGAEFDIIMCFIVS